MFGKKTVLKITITDDKITMRKRGKRHISCVDIYDVIKFLAGTIEQSTGVKAPATLAMLTFNYLE